MVVRAAKGPTIPTLEWSTFQQAALSEWSRANGIAVEAYSPLGQGSDLDAGAVTELAGKRGASPAQVVLAWHLRAGNIVIPKSTHPHRIRENLAAAEITLSQDELDTITALESGGRIGADPHEAAHTQMEVPFDSHLKESAVMAVVHRTGHHGQPDRPARRRAGPTLSLLAFVSAGRSSRLRRAWRHTFRCAVTA